MHIYSKRPQPVQIEKVQAEQLKFDAVYTIDGQKYEGKAGDWLVLATDNNKRSVRIMSDADFTSQYASEVTVPDFTSTIEELFTRPFFTRPWLR
jgi:hypothetical protein